jgi:hypothetical protein
METLGDDLVLLSIRPNGVIGTAAKLRFGLSGTELVRLAALRRVDIDGGRIIILDEAPTGDLLLDEALTGMEGDLQPQTAKQWVAAERGDVARRYLERLSGAGTIRAERRKALGLIPVIGWTVDDAGRLAEARARLDAIAYDSIGVGPEPAALAGLASAIGLPSLVYPGFGGRAARKRVAGADPNPAARVPPPPTNDAAVRASIDAATRAAVSAATETAHHAAGHGGHAVGGHHGG